MWGPAKELNGFRFGSSSPFQTVNSIYISTLTNIFHFALLISRSLESVPASPESVLMGDLGGNRRIWTKFDTPSFLAILRDPAGDPQSSWSIGRRLAGAKQYRLFTNTSWPAGVSKRLGLEAERSRALPIFVFSNMCTLHFSSLSKNDRASSFPRSRKAMMCAKPFESEIITFKEGVLSFELR